VRARTFGMDVRNGEELEVEGEELDPLESRVSAQPEPRGHERRSEKPASSGRIRVEASAPAEEELAEFEPESASKHQRS